MGSDDYYLLVKQQISNFNMHHT